jgi:hypothetical protein
MSFPKFAELLPLSKEELLTELSSVRLQLMKASLFGLGERLPVSETKKLKHKLAHLKTRLNQI